VVARRVQWSRGLHSAIVRRGVARERAATDPDCRRYDLASLESYRIIMIDDGRRIEDGESPCVWACVCRHAAIYAHEASNPREIEFFQGERVKVLEYQDPEWWYGVLDSPGTSAGDKTVRERLPQLLYDTHERSLSSLRSLSLPVTVVRA